MASTGSINTNTTAGRYYTFSWSTSSQSTANNTSTIAWKLVAAGSEGWVGEKELTVQINGTTVYSKDTRVERYGNTTVASGNLTITHNTDGTKSFSVYVGAAVYYYGSYNTTASTTFTLDAIPQRARIVSAPAFNDTENPTITYNNSAGNAVTSLKVCISADGYNPTIAYRSVSKTGSSYTFNLTDAERLALQSAFPNENGGFVYFYIQTVLNGTTYIHRMAKWFTIVAAPPVWGTATIKDINPDTVAITNDETKLINRLSHLYYEVAPVAQKGATIASINCKHSYSNYTGASNTITFVLNGTLDFTITDSRGNTLTKTITLTCYQYFSPTITLEVPSIDTDGNGAANLSGMYYNGNLSAAAANNVAVRLTMTDEDGTTTTYTPTLAIVSEDTVSEYSSTVELSGLDYTKKYKFKATITDTINTVESAEHTTKALPVFDWGEDNFNFNVPLTMNGVPMDYIVETTTQAITTNGTWYIEKWQSGKVVMYGHWNAGNIAVTTPSGNIYVSRSSFSISFPLGVMIDAPDIYQVTAYGHGTGTTPFFVLLASSPSATMTGGITLASPTSVTINQANINFYIVGRWK